MYLIRVRHTLTLYLRSETNGCCIFHTANTWDEHDADGEVTAVNLLACRLTSASLIFSSANIMPPPHPDSVTPPMSRPMSFFAKYDTDHEHSDPEKLNMDESTPLLTHGESSTRNRTQQVPISYDAEEQCRLYYYRFAMDSATSRPITHQFALSTIPFEFPTVSPLTNMAYARYVYGCSTTDECFGAALGKATKVDLIVRMDVETLLRRARKTRPKEVTGCVDERCVEQILASTDRYDPIKAFQLPPRHYAQEATFVPRIGTASTDSEDSTQEEDGYLMFYVFNEDQLDESGECRENAQSELWVLNAATMDEVVCKIKLPTRVPYGLHGNWFSEAQIRRQRKVGSLRAISDAHSSSMWDKGRSRILRCLG